MPTASLRGRVERLCELAEAVSVKKELSRDERACVDAERQLLALIHEMQKDTKVEQRVVKLEAALKAIQLHRVGADLVEPPQQDTTARH